VHAKHLSVFLWEFLNAESECEWLDTFPQRRLRRSFWDHWTCYPGCWDATLAYWLPPSLRGRLAASRGRRLVNYANSERASLAAPGSDVVRQASLADGTRVPSAGLMSVVACSSLPPTGYSYLIIIICVAVCMWWVCGTVGGPWTVDRGMWRLLVRPASSMTKCASRASHTLPSFPTPWSISVARSSCPMRPLCELCELCDGKLLELPFPSEA